jgi:hypothetical protein
MVFVVTKTSQGDDDDRHRDDGSGNAGQGSGGGDSDRDTKPDPRRRRRAQPDPVTAAIKRGWDDDKIVTKLGVTKRTIQRHRKDLEKAGGATAPG